MPYRHTENPVGPFFKKHFTLRNADFQQNHHPPVLLYRNMSRLTGKCQTLHTHMPRILSAIPCIFNTLHCYLFLSYSYTGHNPFFFAFRFRMPSIHSSHSSMISHYCLHTYYSANRTCTRCCVTIRVVHDIFLCLTLPFA